MLLSELSFCSLLSYSPRGPGKNLEHARDLRTALKRDSILGAPLRPMSEWVAWYLSSRPIDPRLSAAFGRDVCLVPVPRSQLAKPGDLWVPMRLAQALQAAGLAAAVVPLLRRLTPVTKAASSAASARPLPLDHRNSLAVETLPLPAPRIVLVDDVVTRGATLLGAASLIAESFPSAPILGFAAMRTISDANDFKAVVDPVAGTISLRPQGDTLRRP